MRPCNGNWRSSIDRKRRMVEQWASWLDAVVEQWQGPLDTVFGSLSEGPALVEIVGGTGLMILGIDEIAHGDLPGGAAMFTYGATYVLGGVAELKIDSALHDLLGQSSDESEIANEFSGG